MVNTKSDWLYSLQPKVEKQYKVRKNKTGSWLWLRSWLLIAKFRIKLKTVGKTTRPFRYDLNQIPYDYTVEVTKRLRGLDLIECQRILSRSRKCKKAKWLSDTALQIVMKREAKGKGEKERPTHLNAEFQRIARRDKKAFLTDQCKERKENNRMWKTRDLFRRRQWQPTPALLPRKSHGWRSLEGCSPGGCDELDITEQLHFYFSLSCIGEGNGNPL